MQSVAAASGLQIDQRHRQVIAAQEPGKGACRHPLSIWLSTRHHCPPARPRGRRNRRRGFHGLLIESASRFPPLAETSRADRAEMTRRCGLLRHQPAQGSQSGIDIASRLRRQRPSRSTPAADARCRRQAPPRTRSIPVSPPLREWPSVCPPEQACAAAGAQIVRSRRAIGVQTQKRECPCARRAETSPRDGKCLGEQGCRPAAARRTGVAAGALAQGP